jgi:hypothetical protein
MKKLDRKNLNLSDNLITINNNLTISSFENLFSFFKSAKKFKPDFLFPSSVFFEKW